MALHLPLSQILPLSPTLRQQLFAPLYPLFPLSLPPPLLPLCRHHRCRYNSQKLDLHLPLDLKDHHLLAVAEKFRGLLSLRLCHCSLVTAEGLRTMALAMSSIKLEELALIKLQLGTCQQPSFRNLRKLDLSYSNDKLADEEFIAMLASFNCLRELNARGCKGLTNASVVSMFKSCNQLESVDMMHCCGIEAEAVELFVLSCMGLRRIRVEESKLSDASRSGFKEVH